jgi:hypothetical protein
MALHSSDLVWMNGPKKAAVPDITIFREEGGLKDMTPVGKRGIADYGYRGERDLLSTPNSHDPRALRKFKVSASVYMLFARYCTLLTPFLFATYRVEPELVKNPSTQGLSILRSLTIDFVTRSSSTRFALKQSA